MMIVIWNTSFVGWIVLPIKEWLVYIISACVLTNLFSYKNGVTHRQKMDMDTTDLRAIYSVIIKFYIRELITVMTFMLHPILKKNLHYIVKLVIVPYHRKQFMNIIYILSILRRMNLTFSLSNWNLDFHSLISI